MSKGLSGDYNISNGQLQPSVFEIVNVIGNGLNTVGFWTEQNGISKELTSAKKDNLAILWPGQTTDVPKGWEIPQSGTKLKVGVPVNKVFSELIDVEKDAGTNSVGATGFCVDVFEEVLRALPYVVQFEYIPFEPLDGQISADYDDLVYQVFLQKGSRKGGIAAIVAKIPYIRLFLNKYCHNYTMIDPTYKTFGFAFAFRKGSPLVSDVSAAILNLKESPKMDKITRHWYGEGCSADALESLNLDSFTGLFLISGIASTTALAIFMSTFLYENWYILSSTASIKKKLHHLARAFTREKKYDDASKHPKENVLTQTPSIITTCDQEGMFSPVISTIEIEMQEADS